MTAQTRAAHYLRGQFLLATPFLEDPRFHGGVIYLCEHNEDGALGVMINRPLDISLGEILEQLDMDGAELEEPVFEGGPVQPERGFVLHPPGRTWVNTAAVADGVMLTTSRDILQAIGEDAGPEHFRVALGYAGWGEGQLEGELASNAWLTCPATPDLLFKTEWSQLHGAVLRRLGINLNQLSETVGHA
ncbi:MAG: YqgE/AlgH family protein [Marinobacter sp.]|uniref:YqgE/AlgH family protein n=1 Tax=Marinobacter sp. TaxID=50741 RepID=UPI00299DC0FB|nr:YqgE/AlgH family protein [Marinobacter sp.]MDX1635561.1 YqgE/AlgH family protein [Marinobacter sp.]